MKIHVSCENLCILRNNMIVYCYDSLLHSIPGYNSRLPTSSPFINPSILANLTVWSLQHSPPPPPLPLSTIRASSEEIHSSHLPSAAALTDEKHAERKLLCLHVKHDEAIVLLAQPRCKRLAFIGKQLDLHRTPPKPTHSLGRSIWIKAHLFFSGLWMWNACENAGRKRANRPPSSVHAIQEPTAVTCARSLWLDIMTNRRKKQSNANDLSCNLPQMGYLCKSPSTSKPAFYRAPP